MTLLRTEMQRTVSPETLDYLAEDDLRAIHSRRDLQRINRLMLTQRIFFAALQDLPAPERVVELGAGDGTLMLAVARKLAASWPGVKLTLLDKQNLVSSTTIEAYRRVGWQVEIMNADILDWIAEQQSASREERASSAERASWDVALCNLFLHHFDETQLRPLLAAIAQRAPLLFACEPRRASLALLGSHLVGLLGANKVTREDAVLSVHAGFRDNELSALWPGQPPWQVKEYAAGLFSHCFLAIAPNTNLNQVNAICI